MYDSNLSVKLERGLSPPLEGQGVDFWLFFHPRTPSKGGDTWYFFFKFCYKKLIIKEIFLNKVYCSVE